MCCVFSFSKSLENYTCLNVKICILREILEIGWDNSPKIQVFSLKRQMHVSFPLGARIKEFDDQTELKIEEH